MVQAKINMELTSLGGDLTHDVHEGYLMCSKSKVNSTVHNTVENNVPPWEPCHNDNEDALPGTATVLSLLSPPGDKSNSQQLNNSHIKCYSDCTNGLLLRLL